MYKTILLLFFLIAFVACSDSKSTHSSEQSDDSANEIEGMIRLKSGNVTIGSNDKSFRPNERPAMKVLLDYEFYMGIHEVTCSEYAKVAKNTDLKAFKKCDNDSIPLTDITYYDAILYANAKSKQEGFDTAYTYNKTVFDNEGHCTNLEGFAFHANTKAYRLPTEAEWIYAATRSWNTSKSWNNGNSGYKLHTVCSKGADSTGFCDMAGNAMEWVNDWKGSFRDTTATNYSGAPDGGNLGERIVKGGSYSSSEKEINPYSRGDVYTVISSTRAEYVGFRLAFGKIPNALWMSDDGMSQTSIVTALTGSETIKNIIGSYNVKLAFRNDVTGNIAYIDYLNGTLSVKEITKNIDAYHPDISPDGKWIAFCTGFEGISGKSAVYVQNIEEEKASPIKLEVEKAAIPRWKVLDKGDTVIVYVTDAGNNKDESWKSQGTWQVTFANRKFGTPQKLFNGAYHGGISEDNSLAVTGAKLLRARVKGRDTIWYNGEQACNASLAMDKSKRTAFLDFSGKTGKSFVGKNYNTHQRILIADSTGKLIQSIPAPSGYTFDHTEWTTDNTKTNIVATLTNTNGAHTKIVLVNPLDSSITELAEGEELWHPNLWIKKKNKPSSSSSVNSSSSKLSNTTKIISSSSFSSSSFSSSSVSSSSFIPPEPKFELDLDSAGMYYNTSGVYTRAHTLRYKMEILWQYKDTANIVVLGSSRTYRGVNPLLFSEPIFAVNLAIGGTIIHSNKDFFHNYVLPHYKKLKIIIITIDLDRADDDGKNSGNMFYEAYKSYLGYIYDKNHNYWKNEYPEGLFEATYNSPGPAQAAKEHRQTRGYFADGTHGWGNPDVPADSNWLDKKHETYQNNFQEFVQLLESCKENKITVIGVITPQNPRYKETGSFGKYGIRRSEAPALIKEISDLSITYPNFILMDENNMGDHDYTDDMATDYDHLSVNGAKKLTHRLDSLIKTLGINFTE